ncbi:MAG: MBL fold metallo-hydrolase [Chitinophagales bacterium]|nr:MBL fold metallo-hydrolase [Chitinophagales bacterium]MDW8419566.1 MBL fold metallo-hydrolase [Chitinophagales bacterium]
MNLSFHGAARMVTGSKHLLRLPRGINLLLDCGMFQGNPREADQLNRHWGFEPKDISAVILSHAHIDHCGLIPKLYADGFKGHVYCTPATYDLAEILLLDSAHIQQQDIRYHNKKRAARGEPPVHTLYNEDDVRRALRHFRLVDYGETKKINPQVSFFFTDAGHILGSASVHLTIQATDITTQITYSGDVGRYGDELLRSPEKFPQPDYLILESTYGDSLHEDTDTKLQKLLEAILHTCVEKKGKLIIPAFSVGRTQELIYALNRLDTLKALPDIDFYVDSPLSVEATEVMIKHQDELNDKFQRYLQRDREPFRFRRLRYITQIEESRMLNNHPGPCVIISASGMAESGRVKHHIKHAVSDARNTILLVGYCEPNSLGGKLQRGYTEVTIFGEPFQVKAEVMKLASMSAHADYDDLIHYLHHLQPDKVKQLFLVHGEYDVQANFRNKLALLGYRRIEIPSLHQEFALE